MNRRTDLAVILVTVTAAACAALPAPTPPPNGSPTGPTQPTGAPASSDPDAGWRRTQPGGDLPVGPLADVVAIDDGFLASGRAADQRQVPIVLHSSNGLDWTPEPITSGLSAAPSSLHTVGGRVIGVGGAETARCAHPFAIDTWARDPTGRWTEAPWDERFCAGVEFVSVLSIDDVIHLIGTGSGDQPLSWSSVDGLTWQDLEPALGDFMPRAAIADGGVALVLGLGPDNRPGLRSSVDGRLFQPIPFPALPPDGFPVALVERADQPWAFVAIGDRVDVARRDASGTWTSAPAVGLPGGQVTEIDDLGTVLVALGTDGAGTTHAWASVDGLAWTPLALPETRPGVAISRLAIRDGTVVLVGAIESPDGLRTVGTIWTGSVALLGLAS